jgi:hypothetical protein
LTDKLAHHLASKVLAPRLPKKQAEEAVMHDFLMRLQFEGFTTTGRERPDFIVTFGSDAPPVRISCELTEYCADQTAIGSIDRRLFTIWTKFAERLRERLRREGLAHYHGAIHFHNPDRTRLAADEGVLSDEIVRVLRPLSGSATITGFDNRNFPTLAQHVAKIFLRDTSPEEGILWWAAHLQAGVVAPSLDALGPVEIHRELMIAEPR